MKGPNIIKEKSLIFAIEIVYLCNELQGKKEYVLSKQLMRSGTAIGALIREAEQAESIKDFIHKLSIALKEANETEYWLEILVKTKMIDEVQFGSFNLKIRELLKLLVSIIKTSKSNNL
ncbi:MAG: four helix bundle protein [Saprospiraceae bacterium]|nr:four helix bundle protein [Saprospiraceae bacterium]